MAKYKIHKAFKPRKHSTAIPHGVSKEEIEVRNFVALEFPGTPIYESDRTILHGREIDIWMPTRKLAIEFDGLYYHNADSKSKFYHLWKTIECEKQGIQMIHIFSDEWEVKKPLVIDLIRKTLGKYNTIDAKDCTVRKLTRAEGHNFIDNCDVRGDTNQCKEYIGLFYNNDLISAMGYLETEKEIYIYRYCERRLIKVPLGLNKILEFLNTDKSLISYVDRRLGVGWEFIDAGFEKTEATDPNIWYTKDFKHKTERFNVKLTESQAKEEGFTAIYDCGNIVFKKTPK